LSTALVLVALALAAAALGAVAALRAPDVVVVDVNPRAVVESAGQPARITFDQRLAATSADDVGIEPAVPFTTEVDDRTITVIFERPLAYLTEYRVSVPHAASVFTGRSAPVSTTFTTGGVEITDLRRSRDGDDEVVRAALDPETASERLYSAPSIQEFADAGVALAVVVPRDGGTQPAGRDAALMIVPDDGPAFPVTLPGRGSVTSVRASPQSGMFGYVYTPHSGGARTLWVYDFADPSGLPRRITGIAGLPRATNDWRFVPSSTSVIVQDQERLLTIIDVSAEMLTALPLGEHYELHDFVPGSRRLWVSDPTSASLLDVASGELTALDLPVPQVGADEYPTAFAALTDDGAAVATGYEKVDIEANRAVGASVQVTDANGTRVLWSAPSPETRLGGMCSSPNGRLLAVSTFAGDSDDDYVRPGHETTTVVLIDAATGTEVRAIVGMLPSWCSS
jgi:hypothetical protein